MKAMITGFVAIVLVSIGAFYGLGQAGFSSQEVHSGADVRLD